MSIEELVVRKFYQKGSELNYRGFFFFYRKLGDQNVSNTIAGSMRTKETAIRLHTMPELLMGQNV